MINILVTGGSGQLGWELRRELVCLGSVHAPPRSELDLERPESVAYAIREIRPEVVVNAAAYTAVEQAESDPRRAEMVNVDAPRLLAELVRSRKAILFHYSTDYVFDGQTDRALTETCDTAPLNVYGRTKRCGEVEILAQGGSSYIFRTSWLYGNRGQNFLNSMLRIARENRPLRVVDDQFGVPNWTRVVAAASAMALSRLLPLRPGLATPAPAPGIYHLSCRGRTSWHRFACAIINNAYPDKQHRPKVARIGSNDFPSRAKRPRHSQLDTSVFERSFGVRMPHWRQALELCMQERGDLR